MKLELQCSQALLDDDDTYDRIELDIWKKKMVKGPPGVLVSVSEGFQECSMVLSREQVEEVIAWLQSFHRGTAKKWI